MEVDNFDFNGNGGEDRIEIGKLSLINALTHSTARS